MSQLENQRSITGSPQFAPTDSLSPSDQHKLDLAVRQVATQKTMWAQLGCTQRVELLNALLKSVQSAARNWVAASCRAKGHVPNTPPAGEEWLSGPYCVARCIRLLRNSLNQIARNGKPQLPGRAFVCASGQVVAPVFPTSLFDRLLFMGYQAEVWMDPAITLSELPSSMAVAYDNTRLDSGALCFVLGAGNVSSIGPLDALYKLFVENQVVFLKMNPVNEYLTEHFNIAFEPLIKPGFLRFVTGGSQAGKYLCEHPSVDQIHITGSDKTHDAIVYGVGTEGETRKAQRKPLCHKPVTSELGNVSPVILVPGQWSKSDIAYQAENVASMLINNAGFNCNAIRVLITHHQWPQREEFLTALRSAFGRIPARRAYYPGAAERFAAFTKGRSSVSMMGQGTGVAADSLPWALIEDLDHDNLQDGCFNSEAFCSVMGETRLTADSVAKYLQQAVKFANESVWGTLNATIIVSPSTLKTKSVASAFDQAIVDLKYGTVAINHWAGVNFALGSTTWGAFPGHPPHDIQSGVGVVHNAYLFDRAQKTVFRGPFRPFPKPVWLASRTKTHRVGRLLFEFECSPSWFKLPAILVNALG